MIISVFVCVDLCKTRRCFNEHLPSARLLMVVINVKETSKVPLWCMIKRASGKGRFSSIESASNIISPRAPALHSPRAPWIIRDKAAARPCRGMEAALHREPCTPQGAFPELSAQSTAKHWHSVNKRVPT